MRVYLIAPEKGQGRKGSSPGHFNVGSPASF